MEQYTVVGVQKSEFTPKDSTDVIKGMNIWGAQERKGVEGMACERFFISEKRLGGAKVKPGDTVSISYNKWGKVEQVTVVVTGD